LLHVLLLMVLLILMYLGIYITLQLQSLFYSRDIVFISREQCVYDCLYLLQNSCSDANMYILIIQVFFSLLFFTLCCLQF